MIFIKEIIFLMEYLLYRFHFDLRYGENLFLAKLCLEMRILRAIERERENRNISNHRMIRLKEMTINNFLEIFSKRENFSSRGVSLGFFFLGLNVLHVTLVLIVSQRA